jgi:hypothetical protein
MHTLFLGETGGDLDAAFDAEDRVIDAAFFSFSFWLL